MDVSGLAVEYLGWPPELFLDNIIRFSVFGINNNVIVSNYGDKVLILGKNGLQIILHTFLHQLK